MFLYRHALEVALKNAVRAGAAIFLFEDGELVNLEKVHRSHDLQALSRDVMRLVDAFGLKGQTLRSMSVDDFLNLIHEFQEIDPQGGSFRYPLTTQQTHSLPVAFSFNLFSFCERLDGLIPDLEGLASVMRQDLTLRFDWSDVPWYDVLNFAD